MAKNELVKVDSRDRYPQQTVTTTSTLISFLGRILKATDQHLNPPTPEGQIPQAAISASIIPRQIADRISAGLSGDVTASLRTRYIPPNDSNPPLQGEYPGLHLTLRQAEVNGGNTTHFNVFGGLRDPKAAIDDHDTRGQIVFADHSQRTEAIVGRPTKVTLIQHDQNGDQRVNLQTTIFPNTNTIHVDNITLLDPPNSKTQFSGLHIRQPGLIKVFMGAINRIIKDIS